MDDISSESVQLNAGAAAAANKAVIFVARADHRAAAFAAAAAPT
ncbi:hypothetical protein [Thauera sp.]|nr:hypothetical protein [Thauera sp.]